MKLASISSFLSTIDITEYDSYFPGIDCIYIINLEERKDRLEGLFCLLEDHGLKGNRVNAVNGWLLPKNIRKELEIPAYSTPLTGGEIGCFLSHLSVWKDALERGFERIWVIEDDIHFTRSPLVLGPILQELEELDPDFDLLYTDSSRFFFVSPRHVHLLKEPESTLKPLVISPDLVRIQAKLGLHSLILSKKGLRNIMQYMEKEPVFGPVDYQIHFIPGLRKYCLSYDVVSVGERHLESDTTTQPYVVS